MTRLYPPMRDLVWVEKKPLRASFLTQLKSAGQKVLRLVIAVAFAAAIGVSGSTQTCRFSQENGSDYLAMEQAMLSGDLATARRQATSLTARNLSECERKAFLRLSAWLSAATGDEAEAARALTAYIEIAGPDEPDASAARVALSRMSEMQGRDPGAEAEALRPGTVDP